MRGISQQQQKLSINNECIAQNKTKNTKQNLHKNFPRSNS